MEQFEQRIASIEARLEELTRSISKIKKVFYWIVWISVALFVLPLIGLLFVIPQFISTYSTLEGL